jgi:ribonuclease P protein component
MQPSAARPGASLTKAGIFYSSALGPSGRQRPARAKSAAKLEEPREAHLSAAPHPPHSHPWLPRPHEDCERPQGHQQPAPQGPGPPRHHGLQEVSAGSVPTAALGSAGKRPLRLLRSARLRKRFEFRRCRDSGRRVHTPSFVLLVAPRDESEARLGLTVSRRVGCAVRRNRIKRLVREAFRTDRALFPAGADVVVIAKDSCSVRTLADVRREIEAARGGLSRAARDPGRRRGGSA